MLVGDLAWADVPKGDAQQSTREGEPPRGAASKVKAGGAPRRALFQEEGRAPPKLTRKKRLGEFWEGRRFGVAGARRGSGVGAGVDPTEPCRTLEGFVILP